MSDYVFLTFFISFVDTWSGEMPTCIKVECIEPKDVAHSTKFPENLTRSYKSEVVYTCDEGYYMIGDGTRGNEN